MNYLKKKFKINRISIIIVKICKLPNQYQINSHLITQCCNQKWDKLIITLIITMFKLELNKKLNLSKCKYNCKCKHYNKWFRDCISFKAKITRLIIIN